LEIALCKMCPINDRFVTTVQMIFF